MHSRAEKPANMVNTDTLIDLIINYVTKTNFATLIFILGKTVHSAGLNYFSADEFMKYFFRTDEPDEQENIAVKIAITLAILGSAGVNLFVNFPAFRRNWTASSNESPLPSDGANASFTEQLIRTPLKAGAWAYGGMTALLGYFLTHQLSELIAASTGTDAYDAAWKTIIIDIAGVFVATLVFLKYAAYDIQLSKKNADRIAAAMVNIDIPLDKSMLVTLIISLLTLTIAPMQAYFFAKPSLENTPVIKDIAMAVTILTILCCTVTAVAVSTWLPSIYDALHKILNPSDQSNDEKNKDDKTPAVVAGIFKGTAHATGLLDATTQGLANYMGMIAVAQRVLGVDPYKATMITLASIALLNGTITHYAYSVAPGVEMSYQGFAKMFSSSQKKNDVEVGGSDLDQCINADSDQSDAPNEFTPLLSGNGIEIVNATASHNIFTCNSPGKGSALFSIASTSQHSDETHSPRLLKLNHQIPRAASSNLTLDEPVESDAARAAAYELITDSSTRSKMNSSP